MGNPTAEPAGLWDFDPNERIRRCSRCDKVKRLDEFNRRPGRNIGFATICRECWNEYRQGWREGRQEQERANGRRLYADNPERRRMDQLKHLYNITAAEYQALLDSQDGVCAICAELCETGKRLAVDHDHRCCPGAKSCGKCIRGLLCRRCNQVLGRLKDDPELFMRAANYLLAGQ